MKAMSKYFLGLLVGIFASSAYIAADCDDCKCDPTSRSYLSVRPEFQSVSPTMVAGFRGDRTHAREDGYHGALQFVLFGSKSDNQGELARYFFPFCKRKLIVDEAIVNTAATTPIEADLASQHFNIFTVNGTFRSEISICPEQSTVGLGIHYRQSFYRDEEKGHGYFFSFSMPIERVRNKMNLYENVIDDGGGPDETADLYVAANMREGLRQQEFISSRIDCRCDMTETRVADVELKLGYEWLEYDPCHLETYVGLLVPAGNKPNPRYLFSPVVGHGRHFGIMWGSAFGKEVWRSQSVDDRYLRMEYALHSQFLFKNHQCRVFDLKYKPWSRYIQMYANLEQAQEAAALVATNPSLARNLATPGVDILTLPVSVTPRYSFNMTGALVLTSGGFQGEVGYNFFARASECVELECGFPAGAAIKDRQGDGHTNPVRDITGNQILEDISTETPDITGLDFYTQNQISAEDIDLLSGTQPSVTIHTIYGSLGYRWDERNYPWFINGGAGYEFNDGSNASLDRWTIWAKTGVSF